jgi:hypothetical protein
LPGDIRLDQLHGVIQIAFGWEHAHLVHDVVVEAIDPAAVDPTVVCLAAERAGPPEDSGGVPGYQNLVAAVDDPEHPDHDHYLDWLGESFDPASVDRDAINAALANVAVASE